MVSRVTDTVAPSRRGSGCSPSRSVVRSVPVETLHTSNQGASMRKNVKIVVGAALGVSEAAGGDFEEGLAVVAFELTQAGETGRHPLDEPPLPHGLGVHLAR